MYGGHGLSRFLINVENGLADAPTPHTRTMDLSPKFPRVPEEDGLVQGWESVC